MIALLLAAALQDYDGLIRRLGDDDLADREKAATELRSAGAGALPALRKAAASSDVEIAGRARAVILAIERDERVRRAIPATSRIVLKTRGRTYGEAIEEIRRQTGRALGFAPGAKALSDRPAPEVELADASLGEALLALGVGCAEDDKGGVWVIEVPSGLRRQVRGALEMRPSMARSVASLEYALEPGHSAARALVLESVVARDEKGDALPVGRPRTVLAPRGAYAWVCDVPAKIASLRVRATVLYAVETRTVRLAPAEEWRTDEAAGFRFTHRRRATTPPDIVVQVRPVVPGPDADLRLDALESSRPVLRGPDKSAMAARLTGPVRMIAESDAGVDAYRYFMLERGKEADPWNVRELELEVAVDVEARTYEFEFKDLVRRDE